MCSKRAAIRGRSHRVSLTSAVAGRNCHDQEDAEQQSTRDRRADQAHHLQLPIRHANGRPVRQMNQSSLERLRRCRYAS
jgi:hypothetical protein